MVKQALRRASYVGKMVKQASVASLESLRNRAVPLQKKRKHSKFDVDVQTTRVGLHGL